METLQPLQKKSITTLIDRRSNLSRKELLKEYIEPSKPVILTDAINSWPAYKKFTPSFFKNNYGHLTKKLQGNIYTLADYIEMMFASTPENPAPYPFNINMQRQVPELLADIQPEILYAKSNRIHHPLFPKSLLTGTHVYELFFGGNGAGFPYLHVDLLSLHTQITQLYGSKEFILYPPEQSPYMYRKADNPNASSVNVFNPDYEKYPLFAKAKPIYVTVEEGETILFPTGWWHTTKMHEPSISLGRVQLNNYNWNAFINENEKAWHQIHPNHPKLKLPVILYGKMLGTIMNIQEKFAK